MTKLTDTDLMPWGKYKGTPMQDVPTYYLYYMYVEGTNGQPLKMNKSNPVTQYILDNMTALEFEYPDGEWR